MFLNSFKLFQTVLNSWGSYAATGSEITEKENFSVITVMLLFTKSQLCHFTNLAQGGRRGSKLMNSTKELILCNCIAINTKWKGFLMK